jgi:hypothetical protein
MSLYVRPKILFTLLLCTHLGSIYTEKVHNKTSILTHIKQIAKNIIANAKEVVTSQAKNPASFQDQVKFHIKGILISYLASFTKILGHELGHALMAKLLFKAPIRIVIGSNSFFIPRVPEPLPTSAITFGGFLLGGSTLVDNVYLTTATPIQKIVFFAAGPIAELITAWIINKNIPRICKNIKLVGIYYSGILNFIPIKFNDMIATDGYQIMVEARKIIQSC